MDSLGGGGVAMRRLTLLASAVALGVIASGSAVSQSSSPPLGRDARRIGQQPQATNPFPSGVMAIGEEIGRASCRERVEIWVGEVAVKQKKEKNREDDAEG